DALPIWRCCRTWSAESGDARLPPRRRCAPRSRLQGERALCLPGDGFPALEPALLLAGGAAGRAASASQGAGGGARTLRLPPAARAPEAGGLVRQRQADPPPRPGG